MGDPNICPVRVRLESVPSLRANPKSATRGRSSDPTSTFDGLRSRCRIPRSWAKWIASAMDLITAIYYYRGAKDSLFQMMRVMAVEQSRVQAEAEAAAMVARKEIKRSEKEEVMRQKEAQKTKELQAKYLEKYSKDMADNKNIVYESREKEK